MRCVALADELRASGLKCHFLCRQSAGNLTELVRHRGFEVTPLPDLDDWQADARETVFLLRLMRPAWVVVDHYALDARWEAEVGRHCGKLMVIDDLANRPHCCDLLLDQTYGRAVAAYEHLIPERAELLLGSRYALLRADFARWRDVSRKRRVSAPLRQLLITFGGVDEDNVTGQVLRQLERVDLPTEVEVAVVMGAAAPWLEEVKQMAQAASRPVRVLSSVSHMAELMAKSDLAIGAAGGTAWERCCLGLPTVQMPLADNQSTVHRTLSQLRAVLPLSIERLDCLPNVLNAVPKALSKLSIISSALADGEGAARVVEHLVGQATHNAWLELQPVAETDSDYLYSLQATPGIRRHFRNPAVPSRMEHELWVARVLDDDDVALFLVRCGDESAGMVRIDGLLSGDLEVSIIMDPRFAGRGLGKRAVAQALALAPGRKVAATVHRENTPSQRLIKGLGFVLRSEDDNFLRYEFGS